MILTTSLEPGSRIQSLTRPSPRRTRSTSRSGSDMRLALDTNRYVDFARKVPEALERVREADHIFMTFVVLAELRSGFLCGSRSAENERTLVKFLNSPRVVILEPDEDTTHHYARLFRQLRVQGTPIPTNDIWIAALVVQHNLRLFARDAHFDAFPQLARV